MTEQAEVADPVVVDRVISLVPGQVAQHPANLRDPNRGIDQLAESIRQVGVLVPLIVVPVATVDGEFPPSTTHVAVDGNRRQLAATIAGVDLPCLVKPDLASARAAAQTMAVTGLARDNLTTIEQAKAVQTMLDLGLTQSGDRR